MVLLRPYQLDLLGRARQAMRRVRSVLVVLPTGGGKTVMFCYLAHRSAAKRKRSCITVHREELVDQTCAALDAEGASYGVLTSRTRRTLTDRVIVASIGTLARRLDEYRDAFDLLIPDEAHHSVARTWRSVLDAYKQAYVLGFSGSPERMDGAGLGDVFQEMVVGPQAYELIAARYLCEVVAYVPPGGTADTSRIRTHLREFAKAELEQLMGDRRLVGDAVAEYRKHMDGKPAVLFSPSLRHAEMMAEVFRRAGYRAVSVDGDLDKDERRRRIRGLEDGSVQVLTSCDLISEGLNIPAIQGIIDMKPSQSTASVMQRHGRMLRIKPDGSRGVILDLAGNVGLHGLPYTPRVWDLQRGKRKPGARPVAPVRTCGKCFGVSPAAAAACMCCGAPWPAPKPRPMPKRRAGELVEADPNAEPIRLRLKREAVDELVRGCDSLAKMQGLARRLGYKSGWAWTQWQLRHKDGAKPLDRKQLDRELDQRLGSDRA